MSEKTLVMTFLNEMGSKTSISISGVRDNLTEAEVSAAMDVIIAQNIFSTSGGDLKTKNSAQITVRNNSELVVR
jgi:putative Ca2+/H+ antiporter (TMEM165/GDT1 family)